RHSNGGSPAGHCVRGGGVSPNACGDISDSVPLRVLATDRKPPSEPPSPQSQSPEQRGQQPRQAPSNPGEPRRTLQEATQDGRLGLGVRQVPFEQSPTPAEGAGQAWLPDAAVGCGTSKCGGAWVICSSHELPDYGHED